MRKNLFVLIIALLLVLAGCQQTDSTVSDTDTTAPPIVIATETQEVVTGTEQTSSTEEPKKTESNTIYEETDIASESAESKPVITETKPPSTTKPKPETTTETTNPPITESTESTPEPTETVPLPVARPSGSEVAAKVAVYINQYRGSSATVLPGLGSVALYRANELVSNFAHTDGIDACNALQYGEFVDMTLYGMSESDSYYQGYNREAIAKGNWGGNADEIAQRIATGFKNSANHWKYLGSSEYSYMAVGCVYDEATCMWYCCICVSTKNYGG